MNATQPQLPDELIALRETGFARWATDAAPAANFRQRFDQPRMPVVGIRHDTLTHPRLRQTGRPFWPHKDHRSF